MPRYDIGDVEGSDKLLRRIQSAESIEDWSHILSDYISFGNNKIHKSVAIVNMNSARDCPNAENERCQVSFSDCYANKAEKQYPAVLPYRRRQEWLWDCMDADTWAKAFRELANRKRNDVSAIRFSEAGDFRHRGDVIKVDRIAELLPEYNIYTYSASSHLSWDSVENFTVNQSNNFNDYGDRLYSAVPAAEDIPDDAIHCPFDAAKENGVPTEDRPKCGGSCNHCVEPESEQPRSVYITLH